MIFLQEEIFINYKIKIYMKEKENLEWKLKKLCLIEEMHLNQILVLEKEEKENKLTSKD
jgi:hypothetical protein